MSTPIEIGSNVVALLKLPLPLKELVGMLNRLESCYGTELRMTEQPKGWLQFFLPETESEVVK